MREVHRILGPTDHPGGLSASEATTILLGLGCALATDAAIPTHDLAHGMVMEIGSTFPGAPGVSEEAPAPAVAGRVDSTADAVQTGREGTNPARAHEAAPDATEDHPHFDITLPSWRLDLQREIDLIEEIARVHGYNRFRSTLPAFTGIVREAPSAAAVRSVRATLLAAGWTETIGSTFCSEAEALLFAPQRGSGARIENPLSEEAGFLRPSLLPGLLAALARNGNRGVEDAALWELGTVFTANGSGVDERPSLAFGAIGKLAGFFHAKGIAEAVAARFTSRMLYFDRFPPELDELCLLPAWLHPGRSARLVMDGSTIGFFGELHPDEAARRKLRGSAVLGELRFDRLLALGLRHPIPRELSRFQPVRRDFSLLLPTGRAWGEVAEAVNALAIPELTALAPAEVLRAGENVPAGEYSLLLRATFQSHAETLREEDLQTWSRAITGAVEKLGGRLRA